MARYQSARLEEYEARFLTVAEDIFDRIRRVIPAQQVERHDGSFSVYDRTGEDRVAKIVIYDRELGREQNNWPRIRDGVYVWVRANGPVGSRIWAGALPTQLPRMFGRMWRDMTVQISPNPDADFAYFPVMAGDDLDEIAHLLIACSSI
jgi:hypothetical protein